MVDNDMRISPENVTKLAEKMTQMGEMQARKKLHRAVIKFFETPYRLEETFFHPGAGDFLQEAAANWEDQKIEFSKQVIVDEKDLGKARSQESSDHLGSITNSINNKFLQSLRNWIILGSQDCAGFSNIVLRKLVGGSLPRIKHLVEEHNRNLHQYLSSSEYQADDYDWETRSLFIDNDVINKAEGHIESLCYEIKAIMEKGDGDTIEMMKRGEFGSRVRKMNNCLGALGYAARAAFVTGVDSEWLHEHHQTFNQSYKLSKIYENREEWMRAESDRLSKSFHEKFAAGDLEAGKAIGLSDGLVKAWLSGKLAPTGEIDGEKVISPDSPVFGLEISRLIDLVRGISYRTGKSRQFRDFISELEMGLHNIHQAVEAANGR